jgi:hypothetical protein
MVILRRVEACSRAVFLAGRLFFLDLFTWRLWFFAIGSLGLE